MIPGILVAYYITNKNDLGIFIKIISMAVFISCVWGIASFIIKSNPYVDAFTSAFPSQKEYAQELLEKQEFSGTSATFIHTNGFGYFLPVTYVVFLFIDSVSPKRIYRILLPAVLVCTLLSLKRSAIVALFVFYLSYALMLPKTRRNKRIIFVAALVALSLLAVVFVFPPLAQIKGFVESSIFFWDDSVAKKNNIYGSSFAMRMMQWLYPFIEVRDNIIFGKGFGWTKLYLSTNDFHPILFGFETIIAEAVVTMGLMGLVVWTWMFHASYKYMSKHDNSKIFYKLFTITQLAIAVATGFSYFVFYGIYTALLGKIFLLRENK
jgi:O-Antigen ligase.